MGASDTMKKYETAVDPGDQNDANPDPDEANPDPGKDTSKSTPIPQAEPQSPVQTEDSPNVSPSKDVHEHSGERGTGNLSGQDDVGDAGESTQREYREVKED